MVGKELGSLPPSVSSLQQCVGGGVGYLKFPANSVPKVTRAEQDFQV